MIVDLLKNWRRYAALAELEPAFEYLEKHAEDNLSEGRIDIDGDRLFAVPQSYVPRPAEGSLFEAHRRYADVQYVAGGAEMIAWAPTEGLQVAKPYDPEKDIAFYAQPARSTPVALPAGYFAVFYPEDAHMPCCWLDSDDRVRKIVIKVRLAEHAS